MIVIKSVFGLIGLAKRAGKISCGESACKEAIKLGKSFLIILAQDVGKNTSKNILDSCSFYKVKHLILGTKESLGHAVGNPYNAVLSINDEGFANGILKKYSANINEGE
ncbi:MAG: ribosomal L7Ae/L30e/S12e/Gadd45 family protein [Clostridia bacterium]|nr:ribosomal L7Ae/L30e/S12e/Gadd45 family protein [Clostridia bacterium]